MDHPRHYLKLEHGELDPENEYELFFNATSASFSNKCQAYGHMSTDDDQMT
jgi:hypothetical protein